MSEKLCEGRVATRNGHFKLAGRKIVSSILWRKTQALPIDRYQDDHTLAAKTQAVGIKWTRERLGSSCVWLWPIIDLLSIVFTPEFLYFHDKI